VVIASPVETEPGLCGLQEAIELIDSHLRSAAVLGVVVGVLLIVGLYCSAHLVGHRYLTRSMCVPSQPRHFFLPSFLSRVCGEGVGREVFVVTRLMWMNGLSIM